MQGKYKCKTGIKKVKTKVKKYEGGVKDLLTTEEGGLTDGAMGAGTAVSGLAAAGIEGLTKSKYADKYTSQLKDSNQATGRAIGAGAGQALNLIAPGLGTVAAPILSSVGGAVQRGLQGNKLEKIKEKVDAQEKMDKGLATMDGSMKADLTQFQAKQYPTGSKKIKLNQSPVAESTFSKTKYNTPVTASTQTNIVDSDKHLARGRAIKAAEDKAEFRNALNAASYLRSIPTPITQGVGWGAAGIGAAMDAKDIYDSAKAGKTGEAIMGATLAGTQLLPGGKMLSGFTGKAARGAAVIGGLKTVGDGLGIAGDALQGDKELKEASKYSKGTKVIEIEGKKTPEIHTDKNFKLKNLGTVPHSKGGNKVVAEEGDVVFPTQNSPEKYDELMTAIMKKDKYKLKKEQAKLPEDKSAKYPTGVKKTVVKDTTVVPELVSNRGIGKTTVKVNGKTYKGLGNKVDQKKNYSPEYVKNAWKAYKNGEVELQNDGAYPTPYFRLNNGPAIAANQEVSETEETNPGDELPEFEGIAARETIADGEPIKDKKKGKEFKNRYNPLELASTAYNLGQGLFGKAEKVKRQQYAPQLESYVDTSNNMRREVNNIYKTGRADARNLSAGSASNFRANAQAAANSKLSQMNEIDSQEYGKQLDVSNRNVGIANDAKLKNIDLFNGYEDIDARNRAVKSDALSRGMEGLSDIGARSNMNRNALQAHLIDSQTIRDGYTYGQNPTTSGTQVTGQSTAFNNTGTGVPIPNNPFAQMGVKVGKKAKGAKSINVVRKYKLK